MHTTTGAVILKPDVNPVKLTKPKRVDNEVLKKLSQKIIASQNGKKDAMISFLNGSEINLDDLKNLKIIFRQNDQESFNFLKTLPLHAGIRQAYSETEQCCFYLGCSRVMSIIIAAKQLYLSFQNAESSEITPENMHYIGYLKKACNGSLEEEHYAAMVLKVLAKSGGVNGFCRDLIPIFIPRPQRGSFYRKGRVNVVNSAILFHKETGNTKNTAILLAGAYLQSRYCMGVFSKRWIKSFTQEIEDSFIELLELPHENVKEFQNSMIIRLSQISKELQATQ